MLANSPLPPEQAREDVVNRIRALTEHFPDDEQKIEELAFYIEEQDLIGVRAYLLTVNGKSLRISKKDSESVAMGKIEEFLRALENPADTATASVTSQRKKSGRSAKDTFEPLVAGKDKIYWRDITVPLVRMKYAFAGTKFSNDMAALREIIHKGELGQDAFNTNFGSASIQIEQGDPENVMLLKLSRFIKTVTRENPEKMKESKDAKENKDGSEDRVHIWSEIMAHLIKLKNTFKGEGLGMQIAEVRDLLDGYQLGYQMGYDIQTPKGSLSIKKGDHPAVLVEKLVQFIADIEKGHPKKFKAADRISVKDVTEKKESDKTYWADVIAGLDTLQKQYPASQYPSIQKLKDMIESGELGETALMVNIGPVALDIDPADSAKALKNKVAIFIGAMKQVSDEADTTMDAVFWRDLYSSLKAMEDTFGDNPDYQLLMMSIDSGTLGTVKDFQTIISGVSLQITARDTDTQMKKKLTTFIDELRQQKTVQFDQQALEKSKKRIEKLEQEAAEENARWRREMKQQQKQIVDQQEKIRELEDQLRREKAASRVQYTPPAPSRSYRSSGG